MKGEERGYTDPVSDEGRGGEREKEREREAGGNILTEEGKRGACR